MSLSERLPSGATCGPTMERPARPARRPLCRPVRPVKRSVHEALLDVLGPTLYDAQLDERELEQQVTQTLQAVLERDETPDDRG